MNYLPDDSDSQGNMWLAEFKSMEKLEEQLQFVIVILYSLSDDLQELFHAEIQRYEKIWSDINFMRDVRLRDSLVKEYPAEYFGRDYGGDDPFIFNMQVEVRINKLQLELMGVLGRIIKSTRGSGFVLGDEV